jgi:hypothetical protein
MKIPNRGKMGIGAGLWPVLLLLALTGAPAAELSASSWEPGWLSPQDTLLLHTYPDPRLAPLESVFAPHGGILVRTRGCLECHRLGEQGARDGVNLQGVGRRLNAEAIERLLLDPHEINTEASMLRPPLTRAEVASIADFLAQLR